MNYHFVLPTVGLFAANLVAGSAIVDALIVRHYRCLVASCKTKEDVLENVAKRRKGTFSVFQVAPIRIDTGRSFWYDFARNFPNTLLTTILVPLYLWEVPYTWLLRYRHRHAIKRLRDEEPDGWFEISWSGVSVITYKQSEEVVDDKTITVYRQVRKN